MKKALIIIIIVAAPFFVLSLLSILLFVSIVWTHRPELSVSDICRECVKEIKNWLREYLSGKHSGEEKYTNEQHYHL